MVDGVHACQGVLGMRVLRREYPSAYYVIPGSLERDREQERDRIAGGEPADLPVPTTLAAMDRMLGRVQAAFDFRGPRRHPSDRARRVREGGRRLAQSVELHGKTRGPQDMRITTLPVPHTPKADFSDGISTPVEAMVAPIVDQVAGLVAGQQFQAMPGSTSTSMARS
jgi:hypothetical protein